jgi:cytoskeletal protein RodZ
MPPADIPPLSAGAGDLPAQEREAASPPPTPRRATPRPPTIFQEIGQTLRRQREVLGLSLEDVERHTHLRQHYLQALENGDLSGLPSPVQGRGMLNNYAIFLGMNPEALLLRFAEGLQARHSATQSSAIEQRPKKARRKSILPRAVRRALSPDLLIGLGLVFFLIVFVGWITIRIFSPANTAQTTATAPSIADVLLATATPTITPTYAPATDTPQPQPTMPPLPTQAIATDPATGATLPPPPATAGVEITVSIRQRSWMRVIVDGKVEFEGRVIAGGAYNFAGAESIEVLTSNGAGMQLVYNGVDMGVLGTYGQIIDRIFTPQGIAEPTPTITPTPGEATAAPSTAIPAGTQPAEASATPAP